MHAEANNWMNLFHYVTWVCGGTVCKETFGIFTCLTVAWALSSIGSVGSRICHHSLFASYEQNNLFFPRMNPTARRDILFPLILAPLGFDNHNCLKLDKILRSFAEIPHVRRNAPPLALDPQQDGTSWRYASSCHGYTWQKADISSRITSYTVTGSWAGAKVPPLKSCMCLQESA